MSVAKRSCKGVFRMSRDFSPRMHWYAHTQFPDLHLSNIEYVVDGKSSMVYTEEELADRRKHVGVQVLASDLYGEIRKLLTDREFKEFDKTLLELANADMEGKDTSKFPKEMTDWYFNRHDHYYHEPNDREFMEYVRRTYRKNRNRADVRPKSDEADLVR